MSDQVIKVTDNSGTESIIAFGSEEEVAAFVVTTGFIKAIEDQAGRWRWLASETSDRELSGYYQDKAAKSEACAGRYRQLAADGITPEQAGNVSKQIDQLYGNARRGNRERLVKSAIPAAKPDEPQISAEDERDLALIADLERMATGLEAEAEKWRAKSVPDMEMQRFYTTRGNEAARRARDIREDVKTRKANLLSKHEDERQRVAERKARDAKRVRIGLAD
ncbi:MAG TPA: hypothetical protein VNV62_17570 [Trebonia sp.]|nr:hypothetical protein [Trebonia sp.]